MIVCSCNVLSDHDVRDCVAGKACRPSVGAVFRHMGCEAQCGQCARNIRALVEQHSTTGLDERSQIDDLVDCRADELAA
jgi:bacterioferritin-associated ferredoxin